MNITEIVLFPMLADLFAGNLNTNVTTQTTSGSSLSVEMKTYYDKNLIDLAEPKLVHDQFGQKRPIPQNGGKTIEFRKYSSLPKALTALTEGVTPDGQKLNVTNITATVSQYGGYVALSDVLQLTAIDNNLMQASKLLASQAGRTLDTITREVLNGGTNVYYCASGVTDKANLVGGSATVSDNNILTVDDIRRAVRKLKAMNAPTINGDYVAIIHPDVAYDLMSDPEWRYPHQYVDTDNIYSGEIGKIAGCRFVETTEAKVWKKAAKDKSSGTAVAGDGSTAGWDVYSTLILGADAYGVTEVSGGGLKMIIKQLGSAGTGDPLDQRATVGWKSIKTAVRLVEEYMIRVMSVSSFNDAAAN